MTCMTRKQTEEAQMDDAAAETTAAATTATTATTAATTPTTTTTIALRMPQPDWEGKALDSLHSKCKDALEKMKTVDSIKARKGFNEEEKGFIKSFLVNCLTKLDTVHKAFVKKETTRVENLMSDVKNLLDMDAEITNEAKKQLIEEARIPANYAKMAFYLFQSDLKDLTEVSNLEKMRKNGTITTNKLASKMLDDYMLRIGNRIKEESDAFFAEYLEGMTGKVSFTITEAEPLGGLRKYRQKIMGVILGGSEGDYILNSRKEAYNEDNYVSDYTTNPKVGPMRQRTIKMHVAIKSKAYKLPFAEEILETILVNLKE